MSYNSLGYNTCWVQGRDPLEPRHGLPQPCDDLAPEAVPDGVEVPHVGPGPRCQILEEGRHVLAGGERVVRRDRVVGAGSERLVVHGYYVAVL